MMKSFVFLSLLLFSAQTIEVLVSNQCDCVKLLSIQDCHQNSGCAWSSIDKVCSVGSEIVQQIGYCAQITNAAICVKLKGCAYIDSACVIFAGCSAYKGQTDSECQSISKYCNSDGHSYCIEPGSCSSYRNEDVCNGKASSGGSGMCVWNNGECRDQKCTEGDTQFSIDEQCSSFIKGCVTNGRGCVTQLSPCSSYDGDIETCQGLIGTDGYCKGVDGSSKCQAKVCSEADSSIISDAACSAYQFGCVTTGYGCVKKPLGTCSTLSGDNIICANKAGSDGKCKGVVNGKVCSVVSCIDAPEGLSTDNDCTAYKKGCITTGRGCVGIRPTCTSYKGTSTTCDSYIGSDGKCKGASDSVAPCSQKICTEANSFYNSDIQCNNYQTGCKTTGKGCIAVLSTCSSYTGDSITCEGYIGTDGKCKGGSYLGPCTAKICSDAPMTLITNEDCANYQTGCIASETGGCVLAGSCSTLVLSTQCAGKSTCQWTPQCVKNTVCTDLTSEILCKTVALQDGSTCWWVSNACVARLCIQAPNAYDSDSLCDSFLKGCLTNKKGCLAPDAPCTNYTGTKAMCESYTIKCTNTNIANDTTLCVEIQCSQNITATSDQECDKFHKGCLTNGFGCVTSTTPCSQYPGTSKDICGKFQGNLKQCWWISGTKCVDKQCIQADTTFTSDSQCQQFLIGCVTTGNGCTSSTDACSAYQGNQNVCAALSKGCSRVELCASEQTCQEIVGATSQYSCDNVLPGNCMFLKDKCLSKGACATYSHSVTLTLNDCQTLTNSNGDLCYWVSGSSCVERTCPQISGPANTITEAKCRSHISTCAANSSGTSCEDINCSHATNKNSESDCQFYHLDCHFYQSSNGVNACIASVNCTDMTMFPKAGCASAITKLGGKCAEPATNNTCIDLTCGSIITGSAVCNITKVKLASGVTYTSTPVQLCVFNTSNNTCESKTCSSAVSHLGITQITQTSQCLNYFEPCVMSYNAQGLGECIDGYIGISVNQYGCTRVKALPSQCATLQGRYRKGNTNIYYQAFCKGPSSGNNIGYCQDRLCIDITNGPTDAVCQAYLSTCKSNGISCVDIATTPCTSLSGTTEACQNFQGIIPGSKCQQAASVQGNCTDRKCYHNGIATTDADCDKYLTGCITSGKGCIIGTTPCTSQYGNQDGCKLLTGNGKKCWSLSTTTKGTCIDRTCAHNTTAITDKDCDQFLKNCLTDGSGCIDSTAECPSYQGTQTDCEKFTGNGKSCTNVATATATTACITKNCSNLTADSYSETVCQAYGKNCHYNGIKCDLIQTCASMKGNFVTCATYVAADGPCKGTALQTYTPTSCSAAACSDAPITLTTDADCKAYKAGCVTNGRGCASTVNCADVQLESSCLAIKALDKNICTWASQCRDIQTSCSSFSANGSSVCLSSKSTSGFGLCVWKNSACTEALCEDLPLSVGSEEDCTIYSKTCTFAGVGKGCVTKGYCTSYITTDMCSTAKSKDPIGTCTWDETINTGNSIVGCRAKNCKDAPTSISSDTACDQFLAGCRTNGSGCFKPPSVCQDFKTKSKCIEDSLLQPCLWYNKTCLQYYKCEDLKETTFEKCQLASPYCTTDEKRCVPLNLCSNYSKQSQCIIGTDGICGWITFTKKCQLFNQCSDLVSKVNFECSTYNLKCISNGNICIEIGECSSYSGSEIACKLGGKDGLCKYDSDLSSCRLRECSDSKVSITTHNGCFSYQINSQTKCTTDGTSCIPLSDCSNYNQAGCVIDSNFNPCIFDSTTKNCKKKSCIDIKKTKSSECASLLSGCISNGTSCIQKSNCYSYTTKEACSAGGTDGACAFVPSSASSITGACKLFTKCSDANSDQTACLSKSSSCRWSSAYGATASSCQIHSCETASKGTTNCVAIPNFDATKYTICINQGGKCVDGDPNLLAADTCFKMSQYTYSWNGAAKKCETCAEQKNNTTSMNNTLSNTTNISQTKFSKIPFNFISVFLILYLNC